MDKENLVWNKILATVLKMPGVKVDRVAFLRKELEKIARYLRTDSLKVICDAPAAINLDGEVRTAKEVEFKVSDKKIRFFYPKGLTWQAKETANT